MRAAGKAFRREEFHGELPCICGRRTRLGKYTNYLWKIFAVPAPLSGDRRFHHLAGDVCEPEIAALEPVNQAFVIQSEAV